MSFNKKTEKDKLVKKQDNYSYSLDINDDDDQPPEKNDTVVLDSKCYFLDGKRRIDYVLIWEKERLGSDDNRKYLQLKDDYRNRFLRHLKMRGVEYEISEEESQKVMVKLTKIHIPFPVMCKMAEELNFRVPLQFKDERHINFSEKMLRFCYLPICMDQELPYVPRHARTAVFQMSRFTQYHGNEDPDTFFTVTQRQRAAYEILATTLYGSMAQAQIGIDRMIEDNIYSAAYPLHEGPYEIPSSIASQPERYNRRQILYHYWAKWSNMFRYQPLDNIREYYGEKIALYFAWLGMYTSWLLPAALVGILVFVYGIITMNNYIPANEICASNKTYKMCPLCEHGCDYWFLSTVCMYAKVTYLFDNPGTIFFSIFMSIWAISFLENWKRQNATLAFRWDVMNFEADEERPRPKYTAAAEQQIMNPVTGIAEPHVPNFIRYRRIAVGLVCIVMMLLIVFIFIVGVIVYRIVIVIPLFANEQLRSKALIVSSSSAAVVNLILILSLGKVYEQLAYKLTQWELPRTETDFEDSLIFKVYLFQFINFYSSIIYIAFFKGRFNGYPGHYTTLFSLRNEECSNGGCLFELAQQMAIIMVGKQIINNIQELLVPKIFAWFHRYSKGLDTIIQVASQDSEASYISSDFKLIPYEGLFDEYLEMVLQFGFITIFVAAFPLAPLFALLNNWLEIRIDASKLVTQTRRPIALKGEDIGSWYTILDFIVKLSIVSNGFLIAFTSEFIPRQLYKHTQHTDLEGYVNFTLAYAPNDTCRYRDFRDPTGNYTMFHWNLMAVKFAFVIVFEHLVFGIYYLVCILIPDVPEKLRIQIRKNQYQAKKALLDKRNNLSELEAFVNNSGRNTSNL